MLNFWRKQLKAKKCQLLREADDLVKEFDVIGIDEG